MNTWLEVFICLSTYKALGAMQESLVLPRLLSKLFKVLNNFCRCCANKRLFADVSP